MLLRCDLRDVDGVHRVVDGVRQIGRGDEHLRRLHEREVRPRCIQLALELLEEGGPLRGIGRDGCCSGRLLDLRGGALRPTGAQPDENYARELMQLFTLGLYQLNADGSVKTSGGVPLETYTPADVAGLSTVALLNGLPSGPTTASCAARPCQRDGVPPIQLLPSCTYSRVTSSLLFFWGHCLSKMVGNPSLCEAVKFVELRLGVVLRIVAHINPVK